MTVKELRKEKNLSQAALAKELGIATSAVGHMENGRMKVSAKIAAKAKEVFGVDLVDAAAKTAPAATKPAAKKSAAKKSGDSILHDGQNITNRIEERKNNGEQGVNDFRNG